MSIIKGALYVLLIPMILRKTEYDVMSMIAEPAKSARFSDDVRRKTIEAYGKSADEILQSLTDPVHKYYVRCNTHKILPEELSTRLRAKGLIVTQNTSIGEALGIEVDGPFEVQTTTKEITVDKRTAESVLQGANVYAPGIVRTGSMGFGDRVTVLSELGDVMATGTAQMSATDVLRYRKGLAVSVSERKFRCPQIRELEEFANGLLYPQSLAAMVTTKVLNPKPGETIVDMNCAPGGKLSHISQLMKNEGKIYGFDRNARKIDRTREIVSALGCENVVLTVHDSRYLVEDFENLKPDRILIDPPCSALGIRPKAYDFTTQDRIDKLAAYQKQFVKAASRFVKPGGTIVYSVCTYTIEECEEIVDFAIRECKLNLAPQEPLISTDSKMTRTLCQKFNPRKDEIGYFIAKFIR